LENIVKTTETVGTLFVVCGPSGVGKSTLVRHLFSTIPSLSFSVSATTRPPRRGEQDGVDYHFVTQDVFQALQNNDGLIENATVYDHSYGTPIQPVLEAVNAGQSLLLDVDVQGARSVKAKLPSAVLICILPPSLEELRSRLLSRNLDHESVIQRRMDLASEQIDGATEFDYIVINDDLATAQRELISIVRAEHCRASRRFYAIKNLQGTVS
jgi:guanylate kinase